MLIEWSKPHDGRGNGKADITSYQVELETDSGFVDSAVIGSTCGADPAYLKCTIPMTKL